MFDRNFKKTTADIISFIRKTVKSAGFERTVIGVSGGVDSATTCFLVARALGKKNIFPVILPYDGIHKHSIEDARLTVTQLKIPKENIYEIDIQKAVDEIAGHDKRINQFRKGNIMSRVRMIYLYDLAKKLKALVCGTENRTEYMLGYFTRFGDEASDFEPLRRLYKTEVKALARYLNVPQAIIKKTPTAGLWPGQTDEEEFGFTYEASDKILSLKFDKHLSKAEIIKVSGIDQSVVEKVLARVAANSFKHKVPKVI